MNVLSPGRGFTQNNRVSGFGRGTGRPPLKPFDLNVRGVPETLGFESSAMRNQSNQNFLYASEAQRDSRNG